MRVWHRTALRLQFWLVAVVLPVVPVADYGLSTLIQLRDAGGRHAHPAEGVVDELSVTVAVVVVVLLRFPVANSETGLRTDTARHAPLSSNI